MLPENQRAPRMGWSIDGFALDSQVGVDRQSNSSTMKQLRVVLCGGVTVFLLGREYLLVLGSESSNGTWFYRSRNLPFLVEEVTRAGAPTGNMMMFPSVPGALPTTGDLAVSGVIGAYTVDLTVSLTVNPGPSISISGSPGLITKSGSAPTRLHITVDGGLSAPQGAGIPGNLALVGSASGECGINFFGCCGLSSRRQTTSHGLHFPAAFYLTLYNGDSAISEFRSGQPIQHAGMVALRTFLSVDITEVGDTLTLPSSAIAAVGPRLADVPDRGPDFPADFEFRFPGIDLIGGSVADRDGCKTQDQYK